MNINRVLLFFSAAFGVLIISNDASAKTDYKCHVMTSEGDKVLFYHWDNKDVPLKSVMLKGRAQKGKKGKKFFIKDVSQCLPLNQQFESKEAKKLDKQTLR